MEWYLPGCKGSACAVSCCSRWHGEDEEEYDLSERRAVEYILIANGIVTTADPNNPSMLWHTWCSNGTQCKILALFPDKDIRSLACRIFPYKRAELSGNGITKRTIGIYLANCPATQPDFSVPQVFTDEVIRMTKEHYLKYFGVDIDVVVTEWFQMC